LSSIWKSSTSELRLHPANYVRGIEFWGMVEESGR